MVELILSPTALALLNDTLPTLLEVFFVPCTAMRNTCLYPNDLPDSIKVFNKRSATPDLRETVLTACWLVFKIYRLLRFSSAH